MNECTNCGISIPSGQNTCSMCYGDPYYGRDGHYLNWLEGQESRKEGLTSVDSNRTNK